MPRVESIGRKTELMAALATDPRREEEEAA